MNKIFILLILIVGQVEACTGIRLIAKDGAVLYGRTLEFGIPLHTSIAFIPKNTPFVGKTDQGDGLSYKGKWAAIGTFCFDDVLLLDGVNEAGLAAGTFYFPGYAAYSPLTAENQKSALSPLDFPNWILTQFSTVEEVKKAVNSVAIVATANKNWGNAAAPFHYTVTDKSGKSITIEPINGKLVVHDNPLGIFTNSPTFDWHMTNLNNYIGLSPNNKDQAQWGDVTLKPFGQGSGLYGLPGDFTPPSRFVRAAIFATSATEASRAEDAAFQLFHILNNFDIPLGSAREISKGGTTYNDWTQITAVSDLKNGKYYFKTYTNPTIYTIDLHTLDANSKNIKKMAMPDHFHAIDLSSKLE